MADEEFTRLCPACSEMCYKVTPLWSWDEHVLNTLFSCSSVHELHSQIALFYRRFTHRPPSQPRLRQSAISRFIRTVQLLWPSCQVLVYGSFATGLYLPSSDIDLIILNSGCHDTLPALRTLARHLDGHRVSVLHKAAVPIVRFFDSQSMLSFDVRVECSSTYPIELQAVEMMRDSLLELPAMGPLYMLLKAFLQEKGLNKLYQHGGIRSYMLFVMVKAFLHIADALMPMPYESPVLALRLLGFLHFYGVSFKSERYGISCRNGALIGPRKGFFFSKEREVNPSCGYCPIIEHEGFHNPSFPYLLAVEDPLKPASDLGKSSRRYPEIQDTFLGAYLDLISPTSALLNSFIPYSLEEDDDLVSSFSRLSTC